MLAPNSIFSNFDKFAHSEKQYLKEAPPRKLTRDNTLASFTDVLQKQYSILEIVFA